MMLRKMGQATGISGALMSCSWQLVLIEGSPWLCSVWCVVNSEKCKTSILSVLLTLGMYSAKRCYARWGSWCLLRGVLQLRLVSMSGPLPVVMLKSQFYLLRFVADCTVVMLDYMLLSVELYEDVYSMLMYGVYDWKHVLRLIQ
uniref:Uncharacterized protein n=1 Tax=Arundo donax TaxID=35708 RepID=A0A0A9GC64_ARUDO